MPEPRLATPTKNKPLSAVAAQALKRSADPARTFESPQEKRKSKKGSDVPPEVRKAAVAAYRETLAGRAKLGRGEGKALEEKFKRYNINLRSIQHWNQTLREAELCADRAADLKKRAVVVAGMASVDFHYAQTNSKNTASPCEQ